MKNISNLSHTAWDCKYHLVWIPKYKRTILYGHLRKYLSDIFKDLALQKESRILEGHLIGDHVHMMVSIPPKYAVSQEGFIKGKSAIQIARRYMSHERNFLKVKRGRWFQSNLCSVNTLKQNTVQILNYRSNKNFI